MKAVVPISLLAGALASAGLADSLSSFQTLYDLYRVETAERLIELDPVGDLRFSVTLREKETGFVRRHEFHGEGANDPSPFLLGSGYYCGTSVILLTIHFPWRHALPQYVRVLDTYAFRTEDLEFIDVVFGPLTDIALQDTREESELDTEMLPPVGVRCLSDPAGKPFEFFHREAE